jgi:RNA polymerase sigma-70 factor (ECF subfamily)
MRASAWSACDPAPPSCTNEPAPFDDVRQLEEESATHLFDPRPDRIGLKWGGVRGLTAVIAEAAPEARLVEECAVGDAAAWRALHRRYFPVAGAFLRKLGVRDGDVEDATQDVFLEMFRYLPRFRGEAELSTWLYRLCITQARRVRRRARLTETLLRVLALAPAQEFLSAPSLPEDIARRRVERALSALTEAERTVFVLYEMEGVPGKQIAEIVSCPEATVWRRLHYARHAFRRAFAEDARSPKE